MNKITLIFYLIFFGLLFLPTIFEYLEESDINLNPFDYARITDVDYTAIVLPKEYNGTVNITERLTFDIHAASKSNLFWELWRDLVEDNVDGVDVKYNVNYVKQILADGTEVPYKESSSLYWEDIDYTTTIYGKGPRKWYHSPGPYNPSRRKYECVFFYVDGLYREQPVFEINYDMRNAILQYNDCSELYLSLYSENTIKYLNSFDAQILVPNDNMPSPGNYEAHTYGTNSNSFAFTESDTANTGFHTFSFSLDKSKLKFRPYNQYIEFALVAFGEDKDKLSYFTSQNDYYYDNVLDEIREEQKEYDQLPFKYLEIKLFIFVICLVISFIILLRLLKADDKVEEKYNFYTPEIGFDYFREIPSDLDPLFASNLVFCKQRIKTSKITNDAYAAILLSLVRKKYIELERIDDQRDWQPNNINIVVLYKKQPFFVSPFVPIIKEELQEHIENDYPELEPLSKTEAQYFNLITRYTNGSNQITMSSFQYKIGRDYDNTNSFVTAIENSTVEIGVSDGYFQKGNYDEPKKILELKAIFSAIIGILILTLGNYMAYQTPLDFVYGGISLLGITFLFGAFIFSKLSKKYVLLTQFGENEYAKWRGLYNFLNSETLMSERTVIELPLWEKYLVYATAFGISEKVINAIKIRCPDIEMEKSSMLRNPYYHSTHFHHSCRSFRSTTHHASSIARSGSYGGHGGYGGGGRGGGGGRRRSLK